MSLAEKEAEEQAKIEKELIEKLNDYPLSLRKFGSISVTSNAIQVSWNHPSVLSAKHKKALYYEINR